MHESIAVMKRAGVHLLRLLELGQRRVTAMRQ